MCFNNPNREKSKVANKDIVCYKFLKMGNIPPYQSCKLPKYIKDKKAKKVRLGISGRDVIEVGYHSYRTKTGAKKGSSRYMFWSYCPEKTEVKKFIIPSGTRYYENKKEYVSETIMLIE